jgi:four helix bundle protein
MSILKQRTKQFTLDTLDLVNMLPVSNTVCRTIANQLARSCSSVGANYRASLRARSDKEFISKMNIVLEEIDESLFWMEIIQSKDLVDSNLLSPLIQEANEITAMTAASIKTVNFRIQNTHKSKL